MVNKSKFTQEEELLLQDFSRNVTKKSSLIFYVNAFLVSVIPVWLFCRIHMMELLSSAILILIVTGVSTYLLSFAYKNTKFILKHKIAQKVEEAVTKEVMKKLSDNKRMSKKEKEERILWKKNEVADSEATTFSLFYNNVLYTLIVILASFIVFKSMSPTYNYTITTLGAAGIIALFSTGTQQ
ncbi:UNVERIFIED_CONTAM: hypothetical protein RMT77_018984 [Armadillidium vulgare]|uniref:Translocon-associated protein subunit gamma n=1 Tax=Armadillidium nasatum TaxID=96803 RepID=A0A5N5STB6_9CRUS|nr:Translocon-associated protein subunit gamma [Armadillidium nasatum]